MSKKKDKSPTPIEALQAHYSEKLAEAKGNEGQIIIVLGDISLAACNLLVGEDIGHDEVKDRIPTLPGYTGMLNEILGIDNVSFSALLPTRQVE